MNGTAAVMPWVTLLVAGANGLMSLGLAIFVVVRRFKLRVLFGDGGADGLSRAIRAHGNNVEYVPLALILMALIEACGQGGGGLLIIGGLFTLARLAHGIGLNCTAGKSPGRALGALLTFIVLAILGIWALVAGAGHLLA